MSAEQGTEQWLAERAGKPTASAASKLITSTGAASKQLFDYADKLAAEMYVGHSLDNQWGTRATERGTLTEPEARDWLAFTRNIDITETGFVLSACKRFGASSDGLIGDDGLGEFKCREAKGHVETLRYHHKHGKPQTTNLAQCHMQMLAMDRAYVLLTYYHPDMPSLIYRIERDKDMDKALTTQISACIARRNETLAVLRSFDNVEKAA